MATPIRAVYVTLGDGADTVVAGTRAIECFDWTDLLASPPKRGENRVIPGLHGTEVRARVRDELRASIQLRLYGEWTEDNDPVPGDAGDWMAKVYEHLATVRTVTEKTGVQPIELVTPWTTYAGECQVESGGTPSFLNPYTLELVLDLTVPDGGLL